MRNLFLFIWKNNYFFLFFILQTLSIFLLIQNNNYQRASFVNSSNAVTGSIYEMYSAVTDYFNLKQENEKLAKENAELRNKSTASLVDYSIKYVTINDSAYRQQYKFIMAKVVNNSVNRRNNYLTLNRGKMQGISRDMAVICPQGIVGVVKDVSENYCTVMSVLHKNAVIPITIKKFGEPGNLNWDGTDNTVGTISFVPSHLNITKGDTIVTSHLSAFFPEGILVGTIEGYHIVSGNTFYTLHVKFSTNFHMLKHVYIVNNIFKQEQTLLEKTTQNDK